MSVDEKGLVDHSKLSARHFWCDTPFRCLCSHFFLPFKCQQRRIAMASETSLLGHNAFTAGPTDYRIVHPLSASPAPSAFFSPSTYQSSPPTSTQQQIGNTSNPASDDVTTIFVVGFPDDMQEREFQNMFTFSPGFEAASLKWHSKDQEEDASSNANGANGTSGAKKQMVRKRNQCRIISMFVALSNNLLFNIRLASPDFVLAWKLWRQWKF